MNAAAEWLDGQLRKYGSGDRVLRADVMPGDQLPRTATWAAVAVGVDRLRERWHAVLAEADGLTDDSLEKLDREQAEIRRVVSRLESEIAAMDAERAELRDALS